MLRLKRLSKPIGFKEIMKQVEYVLNPAQKEFLELPDHGYGIDISLYQGGYGSGKTFSGSLLGIILCLKYPGIRGLVGAQTFSLVRDTTLVSYKEHLEKMGLEEGSDWKELKAESKLVFSNGSEVLFRHLEEPDKIKSLNLGFVEIEEMSDTPQATFDMLLGRLRQAKRPEWGNKFVYRLFGHTNPESRKGWIYRYFVEEKKPNYRRIIAPTTDNAKNLPDGFIESLKDRYSEAYYRVNVLGEDADYVSGLATKGFTRDDHLREDLRIDRRYPIHIACDFNTDPMCWYICQHYNGTVYVLHEIVENYTDTNHCSRILGELLKDYKSHQIILNGDASGKMKTTTGSNFMIMRAVLTELGFSNLDLQVAPKNPPITYRYACWNAMVRDEKGNPHVFIHPLCKYLIYDIENLETEEGGDAPKKPSGGKIRNDPYAKYLTHPTDAVSSLVCYYYPIKQKIRTEQYKGKIMDVFGNEKYEYGMI